MAMSESYNNNVINVETIQFPQHLLLPSVQNILKLRIINNSDKQENVRLNISGERVDITIKNSDSDTISIPQNDNKVLDLEILPKADGFGIISIEVEWFKVVQFTVKVQKVRENVPTEKTNEIWQKYTPPPSLEPEGFDPNEFLLDLSKGEIKKLNKGICKLEDELEDTPPEEAIKIADLKNELSECLQSLIKAYIHNQEFDNALSIIREHSNEQNKEYLLRNAIRAYFFIDFESMISAIDLIDDVNDKSALMKTVSLDLIKKNPSNALQVLEKLREERDFYVRGIFQIILNFLNNSQNEQAESLLMKLFYLAKNGENINYDLMKDVVYSIAEKFTPQKAEKVILSIEDQQLKEKLAKDLFDDIYRMVDEVREKIEHRSIASYRYRVNISTQQGENFTKFAAMGGNVSDNILAGQFDFDILVVSLISQNFSLFPTLDRLYSDIAQQDEKQIGYVIFPSKESLNQEELPILSEVLKRLIASKTQAIQMKIYNIDFIPYLGKPTLIIGAEESRGLPLKEKLERSLSSVNINLNTDLFEGGKIIGYLMKIFNQQITRPINLVFSYEFINQYEEFLNCINLLV
ncbi:MAG: hypothetical protein GF311_21340 [Candidatus Lokiarchaeota archaeon]|nr:hypothetical protein [Candidatus Lokiarchaeota archaeon]